MAGWQSGYAAACKAVDAGSIPTPASNESCYFILMLIHKARVGITFLRLIKSPGGEIGRRKGLKIPRD